MKNIQSFYTVKEVASMLKVKENTVRNYVKNGKLKFHEKKITGLKHIYLFTDKELNEFKEKNKIS